MRLFLGSLSALVVCASQPLFADVTSIPMTLAPQGAYGGADIHIPIVIAGVSRSIPLDTGASMTMIEDDDLAKSFPVLKGPQPRPGAAGGSVDCATVEVPSIEVGHFTRERFPAWLCAGPSGNFDNLGIDYFSGETFTLDFRRDLLEIGSTLRGPSFPIHRYPAKPGRWMGVPISIGHPVSVAAFALFDTGAATTVVDTEFVKAHPDLFSSPISVGTGSDVNNKEFEATVYRIKRLAIGPVVFEDAIVASMDLGAFRMMFGTDSPMIVGMNLLRQLNWTFDLSTDTWSVERY